MARYLTINSAFNPITFAERIAPLEKYKAEYESQQDALDELAKYQSLADLSNSELDKDIYNQYKNWNDSLSGTIDDLMSSGKLNSNAIRTLRREYLSKLAPAKEKLKKRNELVAQQAKEYSPTTMYDIDYSNVGLNDINDGSAYRTYKLDDIVANTAKELFSNYVAGKSDTEENEIKNQLGKIDTDNLSEDQIKSITEAIKEGRTTALVSMKEYNEKKKDEEWERNYKIDRLNKERDTQKFSPFNLDGTKNPDYLQVLVNRKMVQTDDNGNIVRGKDGDPVAVDGKVDTNSLSRVGSKNIGGKEYEVYVDYLGTRVMKVGSSYISLSGIEDNPVELARRTGNTTYTIKQNTLSFSINGNTISRQHETPEGTAGKPTVYSRYSDIPDNWKAQLKKFADNNFANTFDKSLNGYTIEELMSGIDYNINGEGEKTGGVRLQVTVVPVYNKKGKEIGAELSLNFVPNND